MKRNSVSSSTIACIGYDSINQILEIEFLKTGVYQYSRVNESTYLELLSSSSLGQFFNARIKNAGYKCIKIS